MDQEGRGTVAVRQRGDMVVGTWEEVGIWTFDSPDRADFLSYCCPLQVLSRAFTVQ